MPLADLHLLILFCILFTSIICLLLVGNNSLLHLQGGFVWL